MSKKTAGGSPQARNGGARPLVRPLSPHLQIWRFHATMLGSILHRMTGVGLVAGAIAVVAWLVALALGVDAYACFVAYAASPLGLLVWFLFSIAAFYHLAAGIRHLIWDTGAGLSIKTANALTNFSFVFTVVATAAFWAWLVMTGKVQP